MLIRPKDGTLRLVESTSLVWHIDAVRGPSTPSLRGAKRHLPSLQAKRSNPSRHAKKEWIASSLALLAMTAPTASHFKQPAVYRPGFAISPPLFARGLPAFPAF